VVVEMDGVDPYKDLIGGQVDFYALSWWERFKYKRRVTKNYKSRMRSARWEGELRLSEINKKKEKLRKAGHQKDAPFCDCKYCMEGVNIVEWCKQREIYRENSWIHASTREEIPTTTQCVICNETMPKWNDQCDACGYVN